LWALYQRFKDPATWRILVNEPADQKRVFPHARPQPEVETIVPGPDDRDEQEVASAQELFELVTNRTPLKVPDMHAYWRLFDWSRAQSFAELERRARKDVPFTQLWEQPEKYRGQPIYLRLHVRRVLQHDESDNPSEITKVTEAWGPTDESRSFPYVVVFTEPPRDLPIGTDVRAEIEFVGYFLKVMSYTAFDHSRGAPLLVGRVRLVPSSSTSAPPKTDWSGVAFVVVAAIAVAGYFVWRGTRSQVHSTISALPSELSSIGPIDESVAIGDTEQSDRDATLAPFDFTHEDNVPKSST
jgi:hypothetical protein